MRGLDIISRTLTQRVPIGKQQQLWQYHPRSDRHSKVACWAILFDLMTNCSLLAAHAGRGVVAFGINHEMGDYHANRVKNLDLVVCRPGTSSRNGQRPRGFGALAVEYELQLDEGDKEVLSGLPSLARAPVGAVMIALEAKACMTEHMKARPRLYDELYSSQQAVHGAADVCIASGFVMVNAAEKFISPTRGVPVRHNQPISTERVIEKVKQLPRRMRTGVEGFDALAITVVRCENDPHVPFSVVQGDPAPPANDVFHYDYMIRRTAQLYEERFQSI